MKPVHRNRRLALIGAAALLLAGAAALVFMALQRNVAFFYTPSELAAAGLAPQTRIRLGGLVEDGSLERASDAQVRFRVTDGGESVTVAYAGILPDLFREGQGVVAQGLVGADGVFRADTILAKHDENYIPRELADIVPHARDETITE